MGQWELCILVVANVCMSPPHLYMQKMWYPHMYFSLTVFCSFHMHIQMAYVLFHEAGLMETFRVPQREFVNYFRALEANYGSNVCKSIMYNVCMSEDFYR